MNPRHERLIPVLAIVGAVTALAVGTSWAKHTLFPLVGAEGTTALLKMLLARGIASRGTIGFRL